MYIKAAAAVIASIPSTSSQDFGVNHEYKTIPNNVNDIGDLTFKRQFSKHIYCVYNKVQYELIISSNGDIFYFDNYVIRRNKNKQSFMNRNEMLNMNMLLFKICQVLHRSKPFNKK